MEQLTPLQRRILEARGNVVVTACPGAGKTRTVAHLSHHLAGIGLRPYQKLVITSFTNVANRAIRDELQAFGFSHFDKIDFGTIDSFLNREIFKPHVSSSSLVDNRRLTLLPPVQDEVIFKRFPKLKKYKLNPNHLIYLPTGEKIYQKGRSLKNVEHAVLEEVIEKLKQSGLILQNEITYLCLKFLSINPNLTSIITSRFPIWIVDEAQDCSELQIKIIELLNSAGLTDVFLIGDPNQSIYEWRDAHPQFIRSKCEDASWTHIRLDRTHRFGNTICSFVNRFHPTFPITTSLDALEDQSELKVQHSSDLKKLTEDFLFQVRLKGIEVSPQNVAIIYGGSSSLINPEKRKKEAQTYFSGDSKEVSELLFKASLLKMQRKYQDAFSVLKRAVSILLDMNAFSGTECNEDLFLNKALFSFFKDLPSLNRSLTDWVETMQSLLSSVCGCSFQIKLKRGLEQVDNLLNDFTNDLGLNVTFDKIHQIKGRTFEAVLVYLDHGSGDFNLSVKKAIAVLEAGKLFDTSHAESGRYFYVACTRAKKLLWICASTRDVERILSQSPQQPTLFDCDPQFFTG